MRRLSSVLCVLLVLSGCVSETDEGGTGGLSSTEATQPTRPVTTTTVEAISTSLATTTTVVSPTTSVASSATSLSEHVSVLVEITNLVGSTDDHLAGVLMKRLDRDGYPWDGVAGFATIADSDPYSGVHVLGEVSEEWGNPDTGLWPWPSGVAEIPPGDYTLQLWVGKDFCCYNRWVPADTPGLRFCEVQVTITGQDQTIRVENIPYHPPLSEESDNPCG